MQAEARGKCVMLPAPFLDMSGTRRTIDHILNNNNQTTTLSKHPDNLILIKHSVIFIYFFHLTRE